MKLSSIILVAAIFSLIGCADQVPPQTVITTNNLNQKIIVIPVRPESVNALPVEWKVLTNTIILDMVNAEDFTSEGIVFYALTVKDYENLALTLADLLRYIEHQNEIILYYENTINRV